MKQPRITSIDKDGFTIEYVTVTQEPQPFVLVPGKWPTRRQRLAYRLRRLALNMRHRAF